MNEVATAAMFTVVGRVIGLVLAGVVILWVAFRLAGRAFARGWREEMEDHHGKEDEEQET